MSCGSFPQVALKLNKMEFLKVDLLIGKTINKIEIIKDIFIEELIFYTTDGIYKMFHDQYCCESVYLVDINGDLNDLTESPIILAEERIKHEELEYSESQTWTFYTFATIKGYVTLRWVGESNGYYSESVDFIKL